MRRDFGYDLMEEVLVITIIGRGFVVARVGRMLSYDYDIMVML